MTETVECSLSKHFGVKLRGRFIALVASMKNLVTSDCEGDWNCHLNEYRVFLPSLLSLIVYITCSGIHYTSMICAVY